MAESASPADILLVVGSDAGARAEGSRTEIGGLTDLHRLLGSEPRLPILQLTPAFHDRPRDIDVSRFRCVLNLITEPELNQRVLGILDGLLSGFGGTVINRPQAVLESTRDQVARALDGIDGLRVPKVARLHIPDAAIEAATIRFPALLRAAGAHTGTFIGKYEAPDKATAAVHGSGDHFLTEFVDFSSADELYRKYRVFWIGERLVLRHMLVAEEWNVHARTRSEFMMGRPDLIAEEEALFATASGAFEPATLVTLRAIRERISLDFFGVDFAILPGGEMLLFEANATMNFFPFVRDRRFGYLLRAIDPAQQALRKLLGLPSRPGGIVMGDAIGQMGS